MMRRHEPLEDVAERARDLTPNGMLIFFHEDIQYKIARVESKKLYIIARPPVKLHTGCRIVNDPSPEAISEYINSLVVEDVHFA